MYKKVITLLLLLFLAFSCGEGPNDANDKLATATRRPGQEALDTVSLSTDLLTLSVAPEIGGRIASFRWREREVLKVLRDTAQLQWGATFWPAPQSDWHWPPPEGLDRESFELVQRTDTTIELQGRGDERTGLQLRKRIETLPGKTAVRIRYRLRNADTTARRVAPWEISRVPFQGRIFFPVNPGTLRGEPADLVRLIDGVAWLDLDDPERPALHRKLFADGREGWLAYLRDGLLYVKQFPPIMPEEAAPGEAEIEIFLDPQERFVELEQQGAYTELQPAESIFWPVTWYLQELPYEFRGTQNEAELLAAVRLLLK